MRHSGQVHPLPKTQLQRWSQEEERRGSHCWALEGGGGKGRGSPTTAWQGERCPQFMNEDSGTTDSRSRRLHRPWAKTELGPALFPAGK